MGYCTTRSDNGRSVNRSGLNCIVGESKLDPNGRVKVQEMTTVAVAYDESWFAPLISGVVETEDDICVVSATTNGWEAVELAEHFEPDVMVSALHFVELDAWDIIWQLRQKNLQTQVIVLSQWDHPGHIYEVMRTGGAGFVELVLAGTEGLLEAIRVVAGGGTYITDNPNRDLVWSEPGNTPESTKRRAQKLRDYNRHKS